MRSKCRAEVVKILSRQKGMITITMGKLDSNKGMWTSTAKEENCLFGVVNMIQEQKMRIYRIYQFLASFAEVVLYNY